MLGLLQKSEMKNDDFSRPRYEGWKVTREEYLDLEEDGFKYDMLEGVLCLAPSGEFEHGNLQLNFGYAVRQYLEKNPVGKAVTEIDVFLPDGEDVLRPDISFILNENMYIVKTHIHGVPDIICEVLSPSTAKRDLGVKADRYLKNGVSEYWIVDPKERRMELWVNSDRTEWKKMDSDTLKSSVLKDFQIVQKEFFK